MIVDSFQTLWMIAACVVMISSQGFRSTAAAQTNEESTVSINADFPGGNVKILSQEIGSVHLEPDLRGDRTWFYWYFEATANRAGTVQFALPEKVAGFKNGGIGFQGPAVSTDAGESWKWMGVEDVKQNAFSYEFAEKGERVRFAVTIPYVESNLRLFVDGNSNNPHLKRSVLAKSRLDREVELLQIGNAGEGIRPVLITARHHAAETMASYVLEGFMQEAISDSVAGEAFRQHYVLYVVPLVDKDGVQAGDQGKNRRPHDHNRDYGEKSIYPEIQAIKDLDEEIKFQFAMDFHCPTLVMEDHQIMYFVGAKKLPAYNFENVSEFAAWIKKGLPKTAPVGPAVWLKDETTPGPKSSRYFGQRPGMIMSATFEFPFAPANKATDPESCRQYGSIMLKAWVNTHFQTAGPKQVD